MKYISLLRGINVSGQKKILMKELKALYENLGFENVVTYIQSGNVIFDSDGSVEDMIAKIQSAITKQYDFDVPVQIRESKHFENLCKRPRAFGAHAGLIRTLRRLVSGHPAD